MNITAKIEEKPSWYGLTIYVLTYTLNGKTETIEFTRRAATAEFLGNLILEVSAK